MVTHTHNERKIKVKNVIIPVLAVALFAASGCATQTRRFAAGETRQTVAGFSEEDIDDTVSRATQNILALDRIKEPAGAKR